MASPVGGSGEIASATSTTVPAPAPADEDRAGAAGGTLVTRPARRASPAWTRALEPLLTLVLALGVAVVARQNAYVGDLTLLLIFYGMLALGMYVPFIMGGALSLAYNAYLAIGAYSVAILANSLPGWPVLLGVPIGMLLSAAIATLLGLVTRGLSGFYLSAATLLFGLTFQRWLVDASGITGGAAGLGNIPRASVLGLVLGRQDLLVLGVLLVWLTAVTLSRLRRSYLGVVIRFQRQAPVAAAAAGVPTTSATIASLAIGATVAALGGSVYALVNQFILAESFSVNVVFIAIFMPLLGGAGSPWGAVLGAIIVVALTQGLTFFQETGSLAFGLGVLIVLLFAPSGVLGYAGRAARRLRRAR